MFLGTPWPTLRLVLGAPSGGKLLAVAAGRAARMGRDKVLGTCAVRYCALPLQKRKKNWDLGQGSSWRERGEKAEGVWRRRSVWRGTDTHREKERGKDEQGTGGLAGVTGDRDGRDKTFWGRKETENSAVGRTLSRTVLESSCRNAWARGGGVDGVMHLSYGTTTAD